MLASTLLKSRRFLRVVAPIILATVTYSGCKKPLEVAPPSALLLVQGGNNQQVQGGLELPVPIVVRVLGSDGKPVADFPVGFAVVQGGGTVNPGSALSDAAGEVKVKWTVGPNEIAQLLRASVPDVEAISISAIALLPSDLIVAQGNNQSAKAGAGLPNPIVVRIVGPGGVPMVGIAVAFQVTAGGGLISPQSGLTDKLGQVTVRWTLGSPAGLNSLAVTSGSLQPIQMLATGS